MFSIRCWRRVFVLGAYSVVLQCGHLCNLATCSRCAISPPMRNGHRCDAAACATWLRARMLALTHSLTRAHMHACSHARMRAHATQRNARMHARACMHARTAPQSETAARNTTQRNATQCKATQSTTTQRSAAGVETGCYVELTRHFLTCANARVLASVKMRSDTLRSKAHGSFRSTFSPTMQKTRCECLFLIELGFTHKFS